MSGSGTIKSHNKAVLSERQRGTDGKTECTGWKPGLFEERGQAVPCGGDHEDALGSSDVCREEWALLVRGYRETAEPGL